MFDRWQMYILCLPESKNKKYLFVVVDSLSKWVEAFPTENQTAEACAEKLYKHVISRFGVPKYFYSDRGAQFLSKILNCLCKYLNIKHLTTGSYCPQSNGLCAKMNAVIIQSLRMYCNDTDWVSSLPAVLMGMRSTICVENSNFSPFYMLYGKEMQLPIDVELNREDETISREHFYAKQLAKRIKITQEIAKQNARLTQRKMKEKYDRKTKERHFQKGDSVFLRQEKKPAGPAKKLFRRWSEKPYYIHKVLPKNTYKVRSQQIDKLMKSPVHSNRLNIYKDPRNYRKTTDNIPSAPNTPENEKWYAVKKIISCKRINNKRHFLVQWVGNYPNYYEPEENISKYLIKQYYVNKSKRQKKRRRR